MTVYQWLCLFGVPSITFTLLTFVFRRIKKTDDEIKALKYGIQALLRDRMIDLYRECIDNGYADVDSRENFENMYRQYHVLGANGVIDNIREKFWELPVSKEVEL